MPLSLRAYHVAERLAGRHLLWRLGRWLYLGARRDLAAAPEQNGEYALQGWLSAHWHKRGQSPVIFDAGARVGDWSRAMAGTLAAQGLSGKLHAFEPAPNQNALTQAALENLPRGVLATVHEIALSDRDGEVAFHVTGPDTGSSRIDLRPGTVGDADTITVPTTTIDAVIERLALDHLHLLKIDTEGHDLQVMRGATAALASQRIDVVQFEYGPHWLDFGNTLRDAMALAVQHGYSFGRLTLDTIEIYDTWHPELDRFILANYVLLAPGIIGALPVRRMKFDGSNVAVAT